MKTLKTIATVTLMVAATNLFSQTTKHKPISKKTVLGNNSNKSEVMTLVSGAISDCTTIIFKNAKGKEIFAGYIPPNFIKWHGEEQTEIDEEFCNKKYLITYTMKKYYCESSGDKSGSLEMNVSKMVLIK
jgi:hypothetical protein